MKSSVRTSKQNSAQASELRAKLLRGGKGVLRLLLNRCGPVFLEKEVALLLGVSTATVRSMDARGLLLGFYRAGGWRYPAWQFDGLSVRPWVAPLIQLMGGTGPALHFLLVPRKSLGLGDTSQPYLTLILANDPNGVATMMRRAKDLATDA